MRDQGLHRVVGLSPFGRIRSGLCLCALVLFASGLWTDVVQAEDLTVVLTSPPAGQALFGEVEIAFEVLGGDAPDLRRVEIFVDDRFITSLSEPPWELRVQLGEENLEHRFEVIAETHGGVRAHALLISPALRVDLEVDAALQQLYVTVEEKNGARVLDLKKEDFDIFDEGEPQEIVTFERGEVPLVALLMVDGSESMKGAPLQSAIAGATAFASHLDTLDQAQVLLFADEILHQTPFTNFPEVLRAGLSGVQARGGTALANHLYLALERLETRQGRRVLILLSDGIDVSSLLDMTHVMAAAKRSRSLVYWLRLGGNKLENPNRFYTAWRDDQSIRRELRRLESVVRESGGRIEDLRRPQDAAGAFEKIAQELREQYVLGFYPSRNLDDGTWHDVEIRIQSSRRPRENRHLKIRHRRGYLD